VLAAYHLRSGIGRYLEGLLGALGRMDLPFELTLLSRRNELERRIGPVSWPVVETDLRALSAGEQLGVGRLVPACDLLVWPFVNVPLWGRRPDVVTIHDTCHLDHPECFPGGLKRWLLRRLYARAARAQRILVPSRFTAERLHHHFGTPTDRIRVVPLAGGTAFERPASAEQRRAAIERHGLPDDSVVFVGNCKPHKNLAGLLSAMVRLDERGKGLPLVVVGEFQQNLDALLRRAPAARPWVHGVGQINDDDLVPIVAGARAMVLPSFYEGFGMTALEAMTVGTPVVCSDIPALRELAGEAAEFVDPHDPDGIAAGIERVTADASRRDELIAAGRQRAARYDWPTAARQTVEVYCELLGISPASTAASSSQE